MTSQQARSAKKLVRKDSVSISEIRLWTVGDRGRHGSLNVLVWQFKEEILQVCCQLFPHSLIPVKLLYDLITYSSMNSF